MSVPVLLGALLLAAVVVGSKKQSDKKKPSRRDAADAAQSPGFKIPVVKTKPKTLEQQLEENLKAYTVVADLLCQGPAQNAYYRHIHGPEASPSAYTDHFAWARNPYGGTAQTGFLHSALPMWMSSESAEHAKAIWDSSPLMAVKQTEWMMDYAKAFILRLKEQGMAMPATGDNDDGPDLGELAEDYARDAMIGYLAAAIPGGVVILAIADQLGIGWTNTSGRQQIDPKVACSGARIEFTRGAEELIAYAYAHPAPSVAGTGTVKGN
ncbi:MAG: hypothetical protein IID33_12670 [Planctomycetes bacterium]|nr:hypothetical protein [Planctomycetota bacterium]